MRKSKVRRSAENVIMLCLAAIVLLSGWKIYTSLRDYSRNQAVYDKIAEGIAALPGDDAGSADADVFPVSVDFDRLREINPDVIGWLYYEDTMINYPVVQGSDNDKYLYTMFDGTQGGFGTLFADCIVEAPFRQFNTIIYGHHMRNGSMFGELKSLKDPSWCIRHPQLELATPEGNYHLMICAFLNEPADSSVYEIIQGDIPAASDISGSAGNDEAYRRRAAYIDRITELSEYMTDEDMTPYDNYVILSTCAYEYQNARYIVVTKMIPAQ